MVDGEFIMTLPVALEDEPVIVSPTVNVHVEFAMVNAGATGVVPIAVDSNTPCNL